MKQFFVFKLKNFFTTTICTVLMIAMLFCTPAIKNANTLAADNAGSPITKIINWLFPQSDSTNANLSTTGIDVYVGGEALGFALECEGAIIVGISDVLTELGPICTVGGADIKVGDILYSINGKVVYGATMIENLINDKQIAGKTLKVQVKRNGLLINTTISPALDKVTGIFKLGLWIRDNAGGVGTLTFVRADNKRFGALGHPVCDIDTGSILPIDSGAIYTCDVVGIIKGERGKPGEIRGLFLRDGEEIGKLDNNTNFGVFGKLNEENYNNLNKQTIKTGSRAEVKLGPAKLLCTLSGTTPKAYDVEIIKTNQGNLKDHKNMVIKIVDAELLNITGGIIQGMSGSPIVQNNKLIGAVTHVFVSDPSKGFATFIENMIDS